MRINNIKIKDWGLMLRSVYISMPEIKSNYVDIPGSDGVLDLTEVSGDVTYNQRQCTFVFDWENNYSQWRNSISKIANLIHGREVEIVLDDDRSYYYKGRIHLDGTKENDFIGTVTIMGELDPYKYERNLGSKWLWDEFSFLNGIIRKYENINVDGEKKLVIPGNRKRVIPTFDCSTDMAVNYAGHTYRLKSGFNKIYNIMLGEGEHTLVFKGNGNVTVTYVGGSL